MEQILLEYGLPKEIVSAIMMLYKNTKAMVRSPDGDTDFFDIESCKEIFIYILSRLRTLIIHRYN